MTKNQIERERYKQQSANERARIEEETRANRNREAETAYHNRVMESLTASQVAAQNTANAEIARSNLARELETNRANVENERIRHFSNQVAYGNLGATLSHNRAMEANNLLLANASLRQADTAQYNAVTSRMNFSETSRANLERERIQNEQLYNTQYSNSTQRLSSLEQKRHNQATEAEQHRATNLGTVTGILNSLGTLGRLGLQFAQSRSSSKVKLK